MTDLKSKNANILLRPRITEKATFVAESGIYAFEIGDDATKTDVREAVKAYFGVAPVAVRIVRNPSKRVIVRGKRGVKQGVKKAYVTLKVGDKIEIA